MDFTKQNLETIKSLRLSNMTVSEMVEAERRVESRFHFADGTWWVEVKPFFYRTAVMMDRVVPYERSPKPWVALGGYYHMVPEGAASNGSIVVTEMSNMAEYQLENLPKNLRYDIRKGLAAVQIRSVVNLTDLLVDGYRVYCAWEKRLGNVRVRRTRFEVFRDWITRVFLHPHNLILGAYWEERLVSYAIVHSVEGVANISNLFIAPDYYSLGTSSALVYSYIRICDQSPGVRKACNGLRSTKDSLERYKAKFGFQSVSYPAFIHLRMGLRPLVRRWMPEQYKRLMGQYQTESPMASPQHPQEQL